MEVALVSASVALRQTTLDARARGWARVADYVELTKPKIAALVLLTVGVSAYLAADGVSDGASFIWPLTHTLLGTALVAASASALNQWLERETDRRMPRTADRPLPAGRLGSREVLLFGWLSFAAGGAYLALAVNPLVAALGLATWFCYVWIYTPLKRHSWLNTVVGAIAGACPVLMGWAAVAPLDLRAAALFTILYLWQFPHFMAIAWLYRRDYAAADLKMLSVVDPSGRRAARQAVLAALLLAPVSVAPLALDIAEIPYLLAILGLAAAQFVCAWVFALRRDDVSARGLLRASLVYLPAVLLTLALAN